MWSGSMSRCASCAFSRLNMGTKNSNQLNSIITITETAPEAACTFPTLCQLVCCL